MAENSETVAGLSLTSIAAIAAVCHEANAAYCRSLGDESQKPWVDAPDNIRASAVAGVKFRLENPDAGDSGSHDNWLKFKEADGWVYGEVKDEAKKTHPCMVPFDQLPKEQQFKDALFTTIVSAAAPSFVEIDQALAEADEHLKALEKAAKKPARAKASPSAKARKIGPLKPGDGLLPEELLVLLGDAERVEIVFSDGKTEIDGLPAQEISGNAWKAGVAGLQLTLPELIVHGPGMGQSGHSLAGYGLLIDGDLVAYADRGGALPIAPGATVNLAQDIVFRG